MVTRSPAALWVQKRQPPPPPPCRLPPQHDTRPRTAAGSARSTPRGFARTHNAQRGQGGSLQRASECAVCVRVRAGARPGRWRRGPGRSSPRPRPRGAPAAVRRGEAAKRRPPRSLRPRRPRRTRGPPSGERGERIDAENGLRFSRRLRMLQGEILSGTRPQAAHGCVEEDRQGYPPDQARQNSASVKRRGLRGQHALGRGQAKR